MSHPAQSLPAQMDALIRLVRGIVLAQGNTFIKELLRERGIRIGTTKTDFEQNMISAIQAGELQRHHIEAWLNEVEGWGDQHAYVYTIPRALRTTMRDSVAIERSVAAAELSHLWNADTSLEYPPERRLTRIQFRDDELSFVWHQGKEFPIRRKDLDYRDEIDGDMYEYRAYRIRSERSVTRFVARPVDGLAAIFVQTAWDEDEHAELIQDLRAVVSRVVPFDDLQPLAVASAIKKLDAQSLTATDVIAYSTRLSAAGAYVEFAATSTKVGYQDVGPVREVRQAVQPRGFVGINGNFMLPCNRRDGNARAVRVQLYGKQRRIKLAYQMTASEVWSIIELIKDNV